MITSGGGGSEIKYDTSTIKQATSEMRSSVQSLDATFGTVIEGSIKLDMVESLNEIKERYDELFAKYETLFINNVQATDKSVDEMERTDQVVARGV